MAAAAASSDVPPLQDQLNPDTLIKVVYKDSNVEEEVPKFVLGYWSIRGLGAPLRNMLMAAAVRRRVPHWIALYDVKETTNPPGGWSKESYILDKVILKKHNALMNCPFLIDVKRQKVICQSNAVFAYLGRALGMMGDSDNDKEDSVMQQSKCEELLCEIMDMRNVVVKFGYNMHGLSLTPQEAAARTFEGCRRYLFKFELHMKTYATHLALLVGNDRPTAPDFHLWELLYQLDGLAQHYHKNDDWWQPFPLLHQYYRGFAELPDNRSSWAKESCFCQNQLPYNNPYAVLGSCPNHQEYQRGQETPWRGKGVIVETLDL